MSEPPAWVENFSGLSRLDPTLKEILVGQSRVISVDRGTCIFSPGHMPETMLFLLDGTVRVQQVSDTGHQIVLYRVQAGQSCVLTTACLLSNAEYAAEALAETDVKAAAVPRDVFDQLVARSKPFRTFVFAAFSKRISELLHMIDDVAFQRLDVRLAEKLVDLSAGLSEISATHQVLSAELGTAREVISRQLQEFQRRGWIEQSRGHIRLLNRTELKKLARHNT